MPLVHVVYRWKCLTCKANGDVPPNNAPEKHTKATGHPTVTTGTPESPRSTR